MFPDKKKKKKNVFGVVKKVNKYIHFGVASVWDFSVRIFIAFFHLCLSLKFQIANFFFLEQIIILQGTNNMHCCNEEDLAKLIPSENLLRFSFRCTWICSNEK